MAAVHATPGSRNGTERSKLAGKRIGPLRDAARAQAHDDVSRHREPRQQTGKILWAIKRNHLPVTVRAQGLYQAVPVDAGDGRLARGIHMRDYDRIGVVEAGRELLEE